MLRWGLRRCTSYFSAGPEIRRLRIGRVHRPAGYASLTKAKSRRNSSTNTTATAEISNVTARKRPIQTGGDDEEAEERAVRARHLLRSILRECSYLPDSVTRQWMKQYALQRFRRYTFFVWEQKDEAGYHERLRAKEKEARRWLTYLQCANDGRRKCLRRVLFMAYGRIGKRRRELMQPLLVNDNLQRVHAAKPASEDVDNDLEEVFDLELEDEKDEGYKKEKSVAALAEEFDAQAIQRITPPITKPLRALLLSQIRSSPPDLTRPNPRRIELLMPMFNSWLRPMPQVRIKNKLQKHYAELLDRVLPPLPSAEWKRLLALANGSQPTEPPVPRRHQAVHGGSGSEHESKNTALEYVVAYGKLPDRLLDKRNHKAISPRFMRRLYGEVLSQCPLMEWDLKSQQWNITWGKKALHGNEQIRPSEVPAASSGGGRQPTLNTDSP